MPVVVLSGASGSAGGISGGALTRGGSGVVRRMTRNVKACGDWEALVDMERLCKVSGILVWGNLGDDGLVLRVEYLCWFVSEAISI